MSRFKVVIFDLDGVLVNTNWCHSVAFSALWQKIGIQGPSYEEIAGRSTREVVTEYTAELLPSAVELKEWIQFKQKEARNLISGESIIYPDAEEALETLYNDGLKLVLATGASRESTELILKRFSFMRFFSLVFTAEDTTKGKPSPGVYQLALNRTQIRGEQTIVIEDSHAGLVAAIEAGPFTVSVRTGIMMQSEKFLGAFTDLKHLLSRFDFL